MFFQAREAANPFYSAVPDIVQEAMDRVAERTGRAYHLFDYVGHPEAERVVVLMGSGCGAVEEAVEALIARGERVGAVKVRLFRPFSTEALVAAMPSTVRRIAVLDRTKEPGAPGEPLYQDVVTALVEEETAGRVRFDGGMPRVIGGRYGLSSKEFTPAMAAAVFAELDAEEPKNHFTVGIVDDVSGTSLAVDRSFTTEPDDVIRAVFVGLGSDGTVSANRNSIKIIGAHTDLHAQGYFVLDSKKAGSVTVSHLRFGPRPIRSTYLIEQASFVACHDFERLERSDVLGIAAPGATLLLNSPFGPDEVWEQLPVEVQQQIVDKGLRLFVVDGYAIAKEAGLGTRINTVLQTCFFALADIFPIDEAVQAIKDAIVASYGKRGETVLTRNFAAVDAAVAGLHEVRVPDAATGDRHVLPPVPAERPRVRAARDREDDRRPGRPPAGVGVPDRRDVPDRHGPLGEAKHRARDPDLGSVDLHRLRQVRARLPARGHPDEGVRAVGAGRRPRGLPGQGMEVARAARDADDDPGGARRLHRLRDLRRRVSGPQQGTGEAPSINMEPKPEHLDVERRAFDFFLDIPDPSRADVRADTVKGSQQMRPLFEFSGACSGCGETPYLKVLTQLFGDRMVVANATGCSSIYGGNMPTTPWSVDADGRGPAWANSLFEDNAEFGMGMRLALDAQIELGTALLEELEDELGINLVVGRSWAASTRRATSRSTNSGAGSKSSGAVCRGWTDPTITENLDAVADALVRRASGSSAATGGPTTSGSAAWTTCSPRAAT